MIDLPSNQLVEERWFRMPLLLKEEKKVRTRWNEAAHVTVAKEVDATFTDSQFD